MYGLNKSQKKFLMWISNNGKTVDSFVADIILRQESYGPKMRDILNEMVEVYKSDYSKV